MLQKMPKLAGLIIWASFCVVKVRLFNLGLLFGINYLHLPRSDIKVSSRPYINLLNTQRFFKY